MLETVEKVNKVDHRLNTRHRNAFSLTDWKKIILQMIIQKTPKVSKNNSCNTKIFKRQTYSNSIKNINRHVVCPNSSRSHALEFFKWLDPIAKSVFADELALVVSANKFVKVKLFK